MPNTGRTIDKFVYVIIGDTGNALREIPVDSIGDVGLVYEQKDVSAWADGVKNYLAGHPSAPIKLTGPVDTSAAVAAPTSGQAHAVSGSYTVLEPLNGDNLPHTLDIRFGVRAAWDTGNRNFGLQRASATNSGYTVVGYTENGDKFSCDLVPMGSVAPDWAAAAFTAGS